MLADCSAIVNYFYIEMFFAIALFATVCIMIHMTGTKPALMERKNGNYITKTSQRIGQYIHQE